MNYIYDILLNFKDVYYDFYEWNKSDKLVHIKRMPIFKVTKSFLYDLKYKNIEIDKDFLRTLENKTEVITSEGIRKIKFSCLFSDGDSVVGINAVNRKIKISSLLIDEEMDILEDLLHFDTIDLNYKAINNKMNYDLKTRKEVEIEKFIKKELEKIESDDEKLKYIYYECFNEQEKNINIINKRLKDSRDNKVTYKLYNFFKLINNA